MQAEWPCSGLEGRCVLPMPLAGTVGHRVAVSYLCLSAPVFSTLHPALWADGSMFWMLSVMNGEMEDCQSVD